MIPDFKNLMKLQTVQDQDEANVVAWVNGADFATLSKVWMSIQKMGGNDLLEVISRFAQLGMTHAVLLASKEKA